jgi:hypothetical protein
MLNLNATNTPPLIAESANQSDRLDPNLIPGTKTEITGNTAFEDGPMVGTSHIVEYRIGRWTQEGGGMAPILNRLFRTSHAA